MKLKNKIKLYFPAATNVKTDKYGFTDFELKDFKDGRFCVWDDQETVIFIYSDIIDKFRPSDAYLSCNLNNKKSVKGFIRDLLWCKARPIQSRNECLNTSGGILYYDQTYKLYKEYKKNEFIKALMEFRNLTDMILDKFKDLIKSSKTYKNNYWSSKTGKYGLVMCIDENSSRSIIDVIYDYADNIGLELKLYGI